MSLFSQDTVSATEPGTSTMPNSTNWETDRLQYGYEAPLQHGTAVKGIIAAGVSNNNEGVSGIPPDGESVCLKVTAQELTDPQIVDVLSEDTGGNHSIYLYGFGTTIAIVDGVDYCHKSLLEISEDFNLYDYEPISQYKEELESHKQALATLQELGDRSGQANTLSKIGETYEALDQYKEALEYYEQALEIYQELGDRYKQAKTFSNIAYVYYLLDQNREALEFYKQELEIYQELGYRYGQANAFSNIGVIYYLLERYEKALESHRQELEIYQELGDRSEQAKTFSNIAEVYQVLGDRKKVLKSYNKEWQTYREMGDHSGQADTLAKIEKFYYAIGQDDKAWYFHLRALATRTKLMLEDMQEISIAYNSEFYENLAFIKSSDCVLQDMQGLVSKPAKKKYQIDNLTCWFERLKERQREKTINQTWPALLTKFSVVEYTGQIKTALAQSCASLSNPLIRFLKSCNWSNFWDSIALVYRHLLFPSSTMQPCWAMAGSGSPQVWQMSENFQSSKVPPAALATSAATSKNNAPKNEALDPPLSALEEDILTALGYKERYGLEIIEVIERASEGTRKLGPGSLYPTLRRLQKKGYLESRWGDDDDGTGERGGARRRYYKVSESGLKKLQQTRSFRERLILASESGQIQVAGA